MKILAGGGDKSATKVQIAFIGADPSSIIMYSARLLSVMQKRVVVVDLSREQFVFGNISYPGERGIIEIRGVGYTMDADIGIDEWDVVFYCLGNEYDSKMINKCSRLYVVYNMTRVCRGVCANALFLCKKPTTVVFTEYIDGMKKDIDGKCVDTTIVVHKHLSDASAFYELIECGRYDLWRLSEDLRSVVEAVVGSSTRINDDNRATMYELASSS